MRQAERAFARVALFRDGDHKLEHYSGPKTSRKKNKGTNATAVTGY
jgi:hypothetical protein